MSDNCSMDKDAYIKQLEAEVAKIPTMQAYIKTLEKRLEKMEKNIQELERRLGMNSQNSSKPPSSDPPGTTVVLPQRSHQKRGARKGHPPHLRSLLPPEKVTQHIKLVPDSCLCGGAHLEETSDEPLRHQVVDLPPIEPDVTEYIQPIYRCRDCGEWVYQPLRPGGFGPGGNSDRFAQHQQTQGSGPD